MCPNASISTSFDWKIFSASQILIELLCTLLEIELSLARKHYSLRIRNKDGYIFRFSAVHSTQGAEICEHVP